MARRIRETTRLTKPQPSEIERLERQIVALEIERNDLRSEADRCERALQEAQLAALEDGPEEAVERARTDLHDARRNLEDLTRMVEGVRAKKQAAVIRAEHATRMKREAKAREHLAEMEAELQKIFAGCEMVAAGVRAFNASKARFYDTTDSPPDHMPHVWVSLDRYVQRAIGARCPVFRGAVSGLPNVEHLATVNEMVDLHRDTVARLYPEPPPAQAA